MLRKITLLAASAILISGLAACGGADTASADDPYDLIIPGTITAGTQPDQPPFVAIAQGGTRPEGFAIDLVEEAAKRLGLKIEYKVTNLNGVLAGISANQYDMGVAGFVMTEERKRSVDFVKPITWGFTAVMTKTDSTAAALTDFAGKKVGVVSGAIQESFASANMPGISLTTFHDRPAAIAQLLSGGIDAFVVGGSQAEEYIKKEKTLKIAVQADNPDGTSLPVKKGNTALVNALDTKIDEMVADGTFMTLYDKWFKPLPLSPKIVEFRPGLADAVKSSATG
jgi:polar amino acid transport system substrate-binding protein